MPAATATMVIAATTAAVPIAIIAAAMPAAAIAIAAAMPALVMAPAARAIPNAAGEAEKQQRDKNQFLHNLNVLNVLKPF